jgi:hypothetical protein
VLVGQINGHSWGNWCLGLSLVGHYKLSHKSYKGTTGIVAPSQSREESLEEEDTMKGLKKLSVLGALAVAGIAGLGSSSAKADFIPTLISVSGSGPNFTYTYAVVLTADETSRDTMVNPNTAAVGGVVQNTNTAVASFFTIYDFQGLVAGSETESVGPLTWGVDEQNVGLTPSNVIPGPPADDATVPDVTFWYNGATDIPGPQAFTVSIKSTINLVKLGVYSSLAENTALPLTNNGNTGNVLVPNSQGQVFTPAPATALGGLVLLGLLGLGRGVRKVFA